MPYRAIITGVLAVASLFRAIRCRGHPGAAFRIALAVALVAATAYFAALHLIGGGYAVGTLGFTADPEPLEFVWSDPDEPYLVRMRDELGLQDTISDADDDFHAVQLVSAWVHGLWDHHGTNQPTHNDPISIVREAEDGGRFRCVEYSIVIHGALNSLGIPTRMLHLKTHDAETRESGAGHVVVEAYLRDAGRWVMIDSQFDAIPMLQGEPLNAVQLQKALAERSPGLSITSIGRGGFLAEHARRIFYLNWIGQYLYFFDVPFDNRVAAEDRSHLRLMLVPLDAEPPRVFQQRWPIGDMVHTHSIRSFYPQPR